MKEFFASNRLSAYIDGELSSAEMAEVDRALRENPQLRQEYERLLATVQYLRSAGPVQAPPDFHAKVLAQVRDEPMPGGFWRRVRGFFAGIPMETVAVAMAAVLVTVVIGQRMDEPDAPEPAPPAPEVQPAAGETSTVASRGNRKVDDAVQEMAELVDRGTSPREAMEPQGSRGGPVQQHIDPKLAAEAVRSTTTPEDGVASLDAEPSEPAVATRAYEEGNLSSTLAAVMAYRLHVDDPRALRDIAALAARHGGVATVDGQPIDASFAFGEATRRQVAVRLPASSLTAFYKDLGAVGAVETVSADSSALLGGGDLVLAVDVMYAP